MSTKAQDRIISINQDTIQCKILSISDERICYELKNNDGSFTGKFIPVTQVAEYNRSHQAEIKTKKDKQKTPKISNTPENRWCIGLDAGGSIMPWYFDNLESTSDYEKLKTGYHLNGNIHYMLKDFLGVGVDYSFFITNTNCSTKREYSPSIFLMMSEKYRQYIHYVGPSIHLLQNLDKKRKISLRESLSAGVLFFRLENQIIFPNIDYSGYTDNTYNLLTTGDSFSAKLGLAVEYNLSKHLSLGLGGDFIWCSLKNLTIESKESGGYNYYIQNQEIPDAMDLSRIDYSFVLRYHF